MPQKVREEERIERIIRGLLKLPDNKRCINCNSLGPQYVCTAFWTFVCTNCSGIHREFTHRVKSVSMAKFTADEIAALQAGGNERAKQIYFKAWDANRNSYPDSCNLHALRNFIKHVYIDRKYSGERKSDYSSSDKAVPKDDYEKYRNRPREDFFERRSAERAETAHRDDFPDRQSFEKSGSSIWNSGKSLSYYIEERSSPRCRQENPKSASHRRGRPANFEIVDNRVRDHETGSARQYGSLRLANADSRARSSSPVSEKPRDISNHPKLLPLKDILGNNIPRLQVGEPIKEKEERSTSDSAEVKKTSSTNEGSSGGKEEENKKIITQSLIDFDADFEPSATTNVGQTQQPAPSVPSTQGADPYPSNEKAANTPNVNPMDSFLLDMAGPVTAPSPAGLTSNAPMPANVNGTPNAASAQNALAFPDSSTSSIDVANRNQTPFVQQNQLFEASFPNNSSSAQQTTPSTEVAYHQPSTSEPVPQAVSDSIQNNSTIKGSESGGRKELPADLFTSVPSPFGGGAPGWQFAPAYGMGYGIQNHPSAMVPQDAFKSRNPFDIGDNGVQQEATTLPFMPGGLASRSPLQGLPAQPSHYAPAFLPQGNPYGMMAPPAAYMGQQLPTSTLASRPLGFKNKSNSDDAFASLNPIQQSSGVNSTQVLQQPYTNPGLAPPNSLPASGGNPFG